MGRPSPYGRQSIAGLLTPPHHTDPISNGITTTAVVLSMVISGGGTVLLPKLLLRRILAWIWLASCTSGAALITGDDASEVSY
ncbi:hypothetical protein ACOQFL_18775 [Actinopolyspora sp. H202]